MRVRKDDDFAVECVPLESGWIIVVAVVGVGIAFTVAEVAFRTIPSVGDGCQRCTECRWGRNRSFLPGKRPCSMIELILQYLAPW